jgi:hypothetical protein
LGRWINRDPIGETGGLNLFQFVRNQPIDLHDPFGELPPSNPTCQALKKKIENIKKEISKRIGEMHEDPLGLPETAPGDDEKPSLSRRGHRKLINELKRRRDQLQGKYDAECNDPEPPCIQDRLKKMEEEMERNPPIIILPGPPLRLLPLFLPRPG